MKASFAAAAAFTFAITQAHAADAPFRIHAGLLVDGTGAAIKDATVTVQSDKIVSVEQGAKGPWAVDLAKATVLPGLIDNHVHITWHFNDDGRAGIQTRPWVRGPGVGGGGPAAHRRGGVRAARPGRKESPHCPAPFGRQQPSRERFHAVHFASTDNVVAANHSGLAP